MAVCYNTLFLPAAQPAFRALRIFFKWRRDLLPFIPPDLSFIFHPFYFLPDAEVEICLLVCPCLQATHNWAGGDCVVLLKESSADGCELESSCWEMFCLMLSSDCTISEIPKLLKHLSCKLVSLAHETTECRHGGRVTRSNTRSVQNWIQEVERRKKFLWFC